jgi:oligopeptide/dipeptide ABC transporter ATP-binding protein
MTARPPERPALHANGRQPTSDAPHDDAVVQVADLRKHFPIKVGLLARMRGEVPAVRSVDGVSFAVPAGKTLGLVGESGCGKTTTGKTVVRLYEPTAGRIAYGGQDISHLDRKALLPFRRRMQMVFQDPSSSLNRRKTVGQILATPLEVHRQAAGREKERRVDEVLDAVGLSPRFKNRYPHEFSGGQQQRIGIARALILNPSFIVADEPVSALDVSIQSQILNLLMDLQAERGLAFLFISHDLSVVKHISDRVAVMYLGEIVEQADVRQLYAEPAHPYTKALLSAVPSPDPDRPSLRIPLGGEIPSPLRPPPGCKFHTRCPAAMEICRSVAPAETPLAPGHTVRCHLYPSGGAQ